MVKYRLAEEKDYININAFHNRIHASHRTLEQFYWEFHNCPFGKSIYIIGEDGDRIVGTNCVIPINLVDSDNQIIQTGKSEDTLVDPDYRGQNIFYDLYQLLFEKCIEHNIKVIWGFTPAYKPFKKLGFDIPFEHQLSLAVNKVKDSYKYLSGLNENNKLPDHLKIFGLCILSKLKLTFKVNNSVLEKFKISKKEIFEGVTDLIQSNLTLNKGSFAILQSPEYQNWRVYQNPYYYKVFTFGFYDKNDVLQGLIVINSSKNKVAYVCHSTFHAGLSREETTAMITYSTKTIFQEGIILIRNWQFNHNLFGKNEIEFYRDAKYKILDRGTGFVWKKLGEVNLSAEGFYLSRMATQGVN